MKISAASFNHFSFWFVAVFATPLFIAVNNPDDVTLPIVSLTLVLVALCLGMTILTSGVSRLGGIEGSHRIGLLFLGFALVLAVQCNIVHDLFFYGNFNGENVNFRNNGGAFNYEWYGFLAGLIVVTIALQWLKPRGRWLAALPVLSSSLLLIPALFSASNGPQVAVETEVDPAVFEFSRKGNLIHLLPDGFQSDIVQQVLEEHPELAAEFEGFTLFSNHLGMFQGTAPSVPTLLTGLPFDLSEGHDYQKVIPHVREHGYPTALKDAGYRLDYTLISRAYCAEQADTCITRPFNDLKSRGYYHHKSEGIESSARILADLSLFRLVPMQLKEKIYDSGHWYFSDTALDGASPWPDPVIREWTENMKVTDGPPGYKFYHYIGTHIPPHWDADCRYQRSLERIRENYQAQTYCVLKGIALLIGELKSQGIYDETAFIISGDHGCNIEPRDELYDTQMSALPPQLMGSARPAFMVKEKNNHQPLTYNHAPTSVVDVAATALELAGVDTDTNGTSVFDLADAPARTRRFYNYSIRELFTGNPVPHVTYSVGDDVRDNLGWIVEQINNYQTAPSSYDPVNYRNGDTFIVGPQYSTSQPDKEATRIVGRQMAFVISQPDSNDGAAELQIALHLPKWITEQNMTVSVNGETAIENLAIERGKGYWTRVRIELDGVALMSENNFVSVQFSHSYLPPDVSEFQVAALIRSIRLVRKPVSGTSTVDASPP
jgi:hypothetical protein